MHKNAFHRPRLCRCNAVRVIDFPSALQPAKLRVNHAQWFCAKSERRRAEIRPAADEAINSRRERVPLSHGRSFSWRIARAVAGKGFLVSSRRLISVPERRPGPRGPFPFARVALVMLDLWHSAEGQFPPRRFFLFLSKSRRARNIEEAHKTGEGLASRLGYCSAACRHTGARFLFDSPRNSIVFTDY